MLKNYTKPELQEIAPKVIDEEKALRLMAIGDVSYEEALLIAIVKRKQEEKELLPMEPCLEDYEREYLRLRDQLEN